MLDGWHEFYTVLGSSAAALVGLLFVTASIGVGYLSAERGSPTRTFTSPIVFHYTYVLFVSLVALVPVNTDRSLAIIVGVSAAVGLVYSSFILVRVLRSTTSDIDDRLGYGASPTGQLRGRAGGGGVHLLSFPRRPAAVGRRFDSFVDRQHPQRLGSDRVLRPPAHRR